MISFRFCSLSLSLSRSLFPFRRRTLVGDAKKWVACDECLIIGEKRDKKSKARRPRSTSYECGLVIEPHACAITSYVKHSSREWSGGNLRQDHHFCPNLLTKTADEERRVVSWKSNTHLSTLSSRPGLGPGPPPLDPPAIELSEAPASQAPLRMLRGVRTVQRAVGRPLLDALALAGAGDSPPTACATEPTRWLGPSCIASGHAQIRGMKWGPRATPPHHGRRSSEWRPDGVAFGANIRARNVRVVSAIRRRSRRQRLSNTDPTRSRSCVGVCRCARTARTRSWRPERRSSKRRRRVLTSS